MAIFILLWWQILPFARIKNLPNLTKNASFQDTVSVHRPGFYAHRFLDFMADKVFKKIPSRKIFLYFFQNFIYISFYIISLFPQMQTRISKAFLFNHCQKPRIFNYNYGFYLKIINKYCNGVKVLNAFFYLRRHAFSRDI